MEDPNSLEAVYKLFLNDIYKYLLHLSKHPQAAQDLTQETFYRAYLYLDNYQGEKVKPWLLHVARNVFIDWHRREKRHISLSLVESERISNSGPAGPEEIYLLSEAMHEGLKVLNSLPKKQQLGILLCDYYGFSYQEAADWLSISLASLKVSIFRGRKRIKELRERGAKR